MGWLEEPSVIRVPLRIFALMHDGLCDKRYSIYMWPKHYLLPQNFLVPFLVLVKNSCFFRSMFKNLVQGRRILKKV